MPELTQQEEAFLDSIQDGDGDLPRCSACVDAKAKPRDDMSLPDGCKPGNTNCDWSPSRFLPGPACESPSIQAIAERSADVAARVSRESVYVFILGQCRIKANEARRLEGSSLAMREYQRGQADALEEVCQLLALAINGRIDNAEGLS